MKRKNRVLTRFRYRGRTIYGYVFHYNHVIEHHGWNIQYTDGVVGLDEDYPLGVLHPWSGNPAPGTSVVPVGSVRFYSKPDGLYFRAVVSKTTAGDEQMTLIKDKAMRSVSVGIWNLEMDVDEESRHITVTKSQPYELSLCPTGMGAFPEARIH